jgi:hypothetical protein
VALNRQQRPLSTRCAKSYRLDRGADITKIVRVNRRTERALAPAPYAAA